MANYKDTATATVVAAVGVFLFFVVQTSKSHLVDREEVLMMGIVCPGRHSCTDNHLNKNFSYRSCECDSECEVYGDCCIDARPLTYTQSDGMPNTQTSLLRCVADRNTKQPVTGVYAISKCSPSWSGSDLIRNNCESRSNNFSDPLLAAPATDTIHRKTYRNLYCAECNGADASALKSWQILMHCDLKTEEEISDEYIRDNLIYSEARNRWGINYRNSSLRTTKFHKCNLAFGAPKNVQEQHVRQCRPYLVSTCPSWFHRPAVIAKCASYMAAVYTNYTDRENVAYKNPHCANCNSLNWNLSVISCLQPGLIVSGRRTPAMSFTLLLDVNTRDGNRVGEVDPNSRCSRGQKWDPFFKKCRNVVCGLPGFAVVDGRCQRRS